MTNTYTVTILIPQEESKIIDSNLIIFDPVN